MKCSDNYTLRDEILGIMIQNDNNGLISGTYGKVTDDILKVIEKRIDSWAIESKKNYHDVDLCAEKFKDEIIKK